MKKRQFGLRALLLAVAGCAVAFAAVRAYQGAILIALFVAVTTIPILALASIVGEWRMMPRRTRVLNAALLVLLAVVVLLVGFAVR